jgi:outer membrane lipoprotein-sorting protein
MTSGAKTLRRELPRLALMLGLLGASAGAFALDLPELMSRLARHTSGEARFTEQRFVRGLDTPLVSTGTLSFAAPAHFERRTLQPRPEAMVVDGNTVTLSRGGRSRTMSLDSAPEAVVAVEAVRATLTGNAATLQRYFHTVVSGDAQRWTLTLTPIDPHAAGPLRSVRIMGMGDDLRTVETTLSGGDSTVMTIDPVRSISAPASAP